MKKYKNDDIYVLMLNTDQHEVLKFLVKEIDDTTLDRLTDRVQNADKTLNTLRKYLNIK